VPDENKTLNGPRTRCTEHDANEPETRGAAVADAAAVKLNDEQFCATIPAVLRAAERSANAMGAADEGLDAAGVANTTAAAAPTRCCCCGEGVEVLRIRGEEAREGREARSGKLFFSFSRSENFSKKNSHQERSASRASSISLGVLPLRRATTEIMPTPLKRNFRFAIDRGGTFTDVFATIDADDDNDQSSSRPLRPREVVVKLLSEDPSNYPDAPREGIRRVLEDVTGIPHPRDRPLDTSRIAAIRMGTTVATNALLERRGERCALLTTRGFRDLLRIGNQARPNIFDLRVRTPGVLPEEFVEVDECVTLPLLNYNSSKNGDERTTTTKRDDDGDEDDSNSNSPHSSLLPPATLRARAGIDLDLAARSDALNLAEAKAEAVQRGIDPSLVRFVECSTGETALVRRPPDLVQARKDLESLLRKGYRSVAIVFKHAAVFPDHEVAVGRLAEQLGFQQVSLSHAVARAVRIVPRAHTAAADAYLTPAIVRYVSMFTAGFDAGISDGSVDVQFMQSDGGLAPAARFSGHLAILSGPAGGYVGYARTTRWGRRDARVGSLSSTRVVKPEEGRSGGGGGGVQKDQLEEQVEEGNTFFKPSPDQVIGFDMGGTSTDISRFASASGFEHVHECVTAGVTLSAPQLDINTVAAGGGSLLRYEHGMLAVGPGSAGAHPGPACYRKPGGLAAVTDANVVLGRLQPAFFPRIFGNTEDQPLDVEASSRALSQILEQVNADAAIRGRVPLSSTDELALGFVDVAVEAMCRPIRALTQAKGHDAARHVLAVFGGAGAQHACGVARALGMRTAFVHRHAGVLSAVGIAAADVAVEAREPAAAVLPQLVEGGEEEKGKEENSSSSLVAADLHAKLEGLQSRAQAQLEAQGFDPASSISSERFLNLRYEGTDVAVMVPVAASSSSSSSSDSSSSSSLDLAAVSRAFERAYRREFGFVLEGRVVVVDDVRVRCVGKQQASFAGDEEEGKDEGEEEEGLEFEKLPLPLPRPAATVSACFSAGGRQQTPVFELSALTRGQSIEGPALLSAGTCTVVVEPGARAVVVRGGSVRIDLFDDDDDESDEGSASASTAAAAALPSSSPSPSLSLPDPVRLALFSHRFMSIAEQMGRVLARTSVSVNIKERLDVSCALFSGEDGSLVANAPHLPVHLGAMSEAVRYQVRHWCGGGGGEEGAAGAGSGGRSGGGKQEEEEEENEGLFPGDVLCSNHPQLAGGSHLPDITIITPVFESDEIVPDEKNKKGRPRSKPIFFVASRGHHADVGGATPGSMPPHSTSLDQEEAAIVSFKLVRKGGAFDEKGITEILTKAGTRALSDNLSDLRAQVAANARGISLVRSLISEHGRGTVLAYMGHIQRNAEGAVRDMLRKFAAATAEKQQQKRAEVQEKKKSSPSPSSPSKTPLPPPSSPSPTTTNNVVVVSALDRMDDGTPISLVVSVDCASGSAEFDFTGTGPQVRGNTNAPPAVTSSAVIYSLRAMVDADIPLNQGCLTPVTIKIPENSILSPSPGAAVVGGNVLTSQRVTDVVLRAFGAAAASQGCMNNFTFGDGQLGYYETVAGGSGAGPGWHGASGVQSHMTNTRITDPEVLERRLPVVLREFSLRTGSGGSGKFRGGDGVVREVEFLRPLTACLLSERRSLAPFGLEGGGEAQRGMNLLIKREKEKKVEERVGEEEFSSSPPLFRELVVNLGGKATVEVEAGDRIRILTPGGGGFGKEEEEEGEEGEEGDEEEKKAASTSLPSSAAAHVPRASGSIHAYAQAQETA